MQILKNQKLLFVFLGVLVVLGISIFGISQLKSPDKEYSLRTMNGQSMEPTFQAEDKLKLFKIENISDIKRDDIIIYDDNSGMDLVKRVIVLPGEKFELTDEGFFINGEAYKEEYEFKGEIHESHFLKKDKEYTLEEDEFFVVGDNRNESVDSMFKGPTKFEYVKGIVDNL